MRIVATSLRPTIRAHSRTLLLVATALVGLSTTSDAWGAPPANDDFANRLVIPVGNQDFRNNKDAGIEPAEPMTANDPAGNGCGSDGTATPGAIQMQATAWWEF